MMYSDNRLLPSGYIHNTDPAALVPAAVNYCLGSGCAPVFVLSRSMTHDPTGELTAIARQLCSHGIITDTKIHSMSLLVLLSSGKNQQQILSDIFQTALSGDGLIYLEDAYRYIYAPARAFSLIEKLVQVYQYPHSRSPLVLRIPSSHVRDLFAGCPSLSGNCFHLAPEPVAFRTAPRQQTQPRAESEASSPQYSRSQQTAPSPQPSQNSQASVSPPPGVPWYQYDAQLLKAEWNGLIRYLGSKGLSYRLEDPQPMSRSKRLTMNVRLSIQELGRCRIVIVYDAGFSRDNPGAVRVAMASGDKKQAMARLSLVNHIFDNELGGHLFQPQYSANIQSIFGAGAAALDAIIRAMI